MMLGRQGIEYKGKSIFQKVLMRTPLKYEEFFENEGCLLYFKNVETKVFSPDKSLKTKSNEGILLRCGAYYFDLLKQVDDEKVELIIIHLYPEMLKELYIAELPELKISANSKQQGKLVTSKEVISIYVDSLDLYFNNPSLVGDQIIEMKIKELIFLLIQTKNTESISELIANLYSPRSVSLKKVIDLHTYSNLQIEQLAKLCNLSLSSFNRMFLKEFNDTPINYLNTKKLEKAKELLCITDMQISEIAYEAGFNDPLYFSRIFNKKIGSSPSVFRENYIQRTKNP